MRLKKINILACVLVIIVLLGNCMCVFADNELYNEEKIDFNKKTTEESVVGYLEELGIVRNGLKKWNIHSYITRRNALEVAYVFNRFSREFVLNTKLCSELELENEIIKACQNWGTIEASNDVYKKVFDFADVEERTYDYDLAANLCYCNIMVGEEVDGKKYANFNEYMTYEQAFITICRMFSVWSETQINTEKVIREYYEENYPEVENPYYQFCIDSGMINTIKTPLHGYSLYVDEDQLEEYITAYEYFYLVNEALYINSLQAIRGSDVPEIYNYRRIDYWFSNDIGGKMRENANTEDIVV